MLARWSPSQFFAVFTIPVLVAARTVRRRSARIRRNSGPVPGGAAARLLSAGLPALVERLRPPGGGDAAPTEARPVNLTIDRREGVGLDGVAGGVRMSKATTPVPVRGRTCHAPGGMTH